MKKKECICILIILCCIVFFTSSDYYRKKNISSKSIVYQNINSCLRDNGEYNNETNKNNRL